MEKVTEPSLAQHFSSFNGLVRPQDFSSNTESDSACPSGSEKVCFWWGPRWCWCCRSWSVVYSLGRKVVVLYQTQFQVVLVPVIQTLSLHGVVKEECIHSFQRLWLDLCFLYTKALGWHKTIHIWKTLFSRQNKDLCTTSTFYAPAPSNKIVFPSKGRMRVADVTGLLLSWL